MRRPELTPAHDQARRADHARTTHPRLIGGSRLRAGAVRAVAASGIVEDRSDIQDLIEDIVSRTPALAVDLLPDEADRPAHIKGFMAASTATLKVELASRFDALTQAGVPSARSEITDIASQVLESEVILDDGQVDAAAAIAGTDRLVSVTGPAGAGKTTMLRVSRLALRRQGRQLVVVAPTKKAASVAGREIGATASSLHALLADHGWRWGRDDAGAELWTRLAVGDQDMRTGHIYEGPRRFILRDGDRVVVDEAGMVDLHTARALAALADETGAGIAMVGDHLQAMPVGHAGAMACMTRRSTAVVELTAVHRFRDPDYAALTLRMREPASKEHALAVAEELDDKGHILRVSDAARARETMVEAYFRWASERKRAALVTSTNEEAEAINEAIQQRRLDLGQLEQHRLAVGQGEQRLLEGDVVQTRLNDRQADVENRALWTVRRILPDALELASISDSGDLRRVSLDYASANVHLAYASTVHGIQGETTDASIVGPGVDASGLYVGMTRGRAHNEAIAIARTASAARDHVADSMMRGALEVSIDDSTRAARTELGRAARAPVAEHEMPAWNDRARRPFGDVTSIDRLMDLSRQRERGARDQLGQMRDWLVEGMNALAGIDVKIARREASAHGRRIEPGATGELESLHDRLKDLLATRRAEYEELNRDHAEQTRATELCEAEWRARRSMDPERLHAEERARSLTQQSWPTASTTGMSTPGRSL